MNSNRVRAVAFLGLAACATPSAPNAVDSTDRPAVDVEESDGEAQAPVEVVVGWLSFRGTWYQNEYCHAHDEKVDVQVTPSARGLHVRLQEVGRQAGTDLTLYFGRDAQGRTTVVAFARWCRDAHARGQSSVGPVVALRGVVHVADEDWSPGRTLTARFALHGLKEGRPILLQGAFRVNNPAR